jgi:hypothetical protein
VGRIGASSIWETTAAAQHPRPGSPHSSEEFALIVLSTYPDGLVLRLSDIAWLELGRPIWTAGCASAEGRPRFLEIFARARRSPTAKSARERLT